MPAPCVNRVSQEDYMQVVEELMNFLEGKTISCWKKLRCTSSRGSGFEGSPPADQIEAIKILASNSRWLCPPLPAGCYCYGQGERSSLRWYLNCGRQHRSVTPSGCSRASMRTKANCWPFSSTHMMSSRICLEIIVEQTVIRHW